MLSGNVVLYMYIQDSGVQPGSDPFKHLQTPTLNRAPYAMNFLLWKGLVGKHLHKK